MDTVEAMMAVRDEVGKSLRSMGVTAEFKSRTAAKSQGQKDKTGEAGGTPVEPEMEALFKGAARARVKQEEMDAFWDQAARKHANKPTNSEVIPYEEARKLGLTPDKK